MVTFKTFEEIWKFSTYHALGKAAPSQNWLRDSRAGHLSHAEHLWSKLGFRAG